MEWHFQRTSSLYSWKVYRSMATSAGADGGSAGRPGETGTAVRRAGWGMPVRKKLPSARHECRKR